MEEFLRSLVIGIAWGIIFCGGFGVGIWSEKELTKEKLRKAIKACHGGGDGRRLLEEVLDDV